jgi:ribosome-binding protein aMBF1 (putative translation factor)
MSCIEACDSYADDMRKPARARPVDLAPAPWPERPANDPIGEVARRFAVNVRSALRGRSLRSVAAAADVDHATISRILAGQVWPDLSTIARLERTLSVTLWPLGVTPADDGGSGAR